MNLINDNIFEEIDEKSIWDDLKNKENNLSYSDFKDVFKQTTVFIYLTKMFGKSIMISPKVKYLIEKMIKYDETYKEYLYESNSKHNTNILYKLYFGIEVDWSDINFKKNKEIIVNLKRGKIIEGIKIEYGILLKKLKEITNDYNSIYMFNGMVLKDDTKLNLFYGEIIDIIPSTLDNFNINIISKNNPITSINISPRTTYRNLQVLIAILIYKDSRIYSQIELNLYNKSLKDNFELKPNDIVYYRRKY